MDPYYRIYSLSEQDAITGASNREFCDDREALNHANGLLAHYPAVEIWQTDRLVARLERRAIQTRSYVDARSGMT